MIQPADLVAAILRVSQMLRSPKRQQHLQAILDLDPEVAELVERLHRDLTRIDQLIRFANADRVAPKYRLTSDEFWRLVRDQDWRCAICREEFKPEGPRINVDHNHVTNEVRGMLCQSCNTGLGLLKDSPDVLEAALGYLEERGCYGPDVLAEENL